MSEDPKDASELARLRTELLAFVLDEIAARATEDAVLRQATSDAIALQVGSIVRDELVRQFPDADTIANVVIDKVDRHLATILGDETVVSSLASATEGGDEVADKSQETKRVKASPKAGSAVTRWKVTAIVAIAIAVAVIVTALAVALWFSPHKIGEPTTTVATRVRR